MATPVTLTPDSLHSSIKRFKGFSIFEDSASTATVRFYNGSTGGQLLWVLNLAASQSASVIFPKEEQLPCDAGLYVDEATGSVTGVLFGD